VKSDFFYAQLIEQFTGSECKWSWTIFLLEKSSLKIGKKWSWNAVEK